MGFETVAANGGEPYQTHYLDQMAAKGIRFEHCYSQPLCTPSRAARTNDLLRIWYRTAKID